MVTRMDRRCKGEEGSSQFPVTRLDSDTQTTMYRAQPPVAARYRPGTVRSLPKTV